MESKIAILITTFLKDELLYQTTQSIIDIFPKESILLIGNQSYKTDEEKLRGFSDFNINIDNPAHFPINYYILPYDCGLAQSRNFLINKAHELEIPYILMMADSIQFKACYDFMPFIEFLKEIPNRGLIGFDLEGSKCPWEWNMELTPEGIKVSPSSLFIDYYGIKISKVDICRNIFLAKTETMLNLYDNEMRLAEHELAFIEYKKRGYEVFWTNHLTFKKIVDKSTPEYQANRDRFGHYRDLLKKKLNINGWIIYTPEARKVINEYKFRKGGTNCT